MIFKTIVTFLLIFSSSVCISQLDLKEIMTGNAFVGNLPENHRWSADGKWIFFEWNPQNEPGNSLYKYDVLTKKTIKCSSEEAAKAIDYDASQAVFSIQYQALEGNLVAFDKKTGTLQLILQQASPIYNVQRLNDPNSVVFEQNGQLYLWKNTVSSLRQLTNFQKGSAKNAKEDSSFLAKQQTALFQYVRDKNQRATWYDKNNASAFSKPKAQFLGDGNPEPIQIHPSGNFVLVRTTDAASEQETSVEHFITANGYTKGIPARGKVSTDEPNQQLFLYQLSRDTLIALDFSHLSGIRIKPLYMDASGAGQFDKDKDLFFHPVVFSMTKNWALCDIRSADNKDRWIVLIDLEKATVKELEHQHDEAWIGGPGISSWNMESGVLAWLEDGVSFYFQSEETGFSHLYSYNVVNAKKVALTAGKFEIHGVQLAADKKHMFITANKTHPGNRDFYSLDLTTGNWQTIFSVDGYHDVQVSPDEKWLAVRYSTSVSPWEIYMVPNKVGTKMEQITHSTTAKFQAYSWRKPSVISFRGSDGEMIYGRLYEPLASKKNGAAVMFVHGAGYLQNAHNYWSHYFREFMFHQLLTDLGYTVLDLDYRASEGYGRNYRTAIYRHMGGRDLLDYVEAKQFMVQQYKIDKNRVGIYGGSYGGFITLMALLTQPDEFACGAALRSVTDWAHYNHEYTSNILNYPDTDPIAYQKSSPIYFAQNLKKPLVMLHGMVDDNVQFQDVVRLSQRFIELGKKDWDLAVYPVESHGFKEAYSWYDEYRRIFELFEKNLKQK